MRCALRAQVALVLLLRANCTRWTLSAVVGAAVNTTLDCDPLDGSLPKRPDMVIRRQVVVLRVPERCDQVRLQSGLHGKLNGMGAFLEREGTRCLLLHAETGRVNLVICRHFKHLITVDKDEEGFIFSQPVRLILYSERATQIARNLQVTTDTNPYASRDTWVCADRIQVSAPGSLMVDAGMIRRLRCNRLTLLGFEPFRHRVELLDVINSFGKRAHLTSHTCCHNTRFVIDIVGLVHTHFTIIAVAVLIFAHTFGARMTRPGLLPGQILDVREGISRVTIFLAIPVDVGPFVD